MRARPVMLVEDNPMDVDLTLRAFEDHKLANAILVCRDGDEAIRYMEGHRTTDDPGLPVVVLLDLRLPKVDGLEVLRYARRDPIWRSVPFVVLTTSRQDEDVRSAYEIGVNSYIVKPVDFLAFADVAKTIQVYWLLTNERPFTGGA